MKFKKWTLIFCLAGMLLLPSQVLRQTALAGEGQTNEKQTEELAPGFNVCMLRSSSVTEMRQCNANAIKYWQDKLDKSLHKAKNMCEQANHPDICMEYLNKSQKAWLDYVDMGANYYMEINGGGSEGLLEQGYFRAKAIKARVHLIE